MKIKAPKLKTFSHRGVKLYTYLLLIGINLEKEQGCDFGNDLFKSLKLYQTLH